MSEGLSQPKDAKENQTDFSLRLLDDQIGNLFSLIKDLESRLARVLKDKQEKGVEDIKDKEELVPLAIIIKAEAGRVAFVNDNLRSILDRLEL